MSVYCPLYKREVVYLTCLECETKECENEEETIKEETKESKKDER